MLASAPMETILNGLYSFTQKNPKWVSTEQQSYLVIFQRDPLPPSSG
jgi:hypothetical protein